MNYLVKGNPGKTSRRSLNLSSTFLMTAMLSGLTLMMPSTAAAQTDESQGIIVNAYRFLDQNTSSATDLPLPIEEVPQSISLVNSDFVKAADLKTLGEIAHYTPGAIFAGDRNSYGSYIKLRGFNAGYAIDGQPVGDSLAEPDFATLERMEVVKGPSSVVYGAGRPGGLVNLVQKSADTTADYVSVLGGSFARARIEGQLTGAIDPAGTIRAIAVGVYERSGSFIHTVTSDKAVAYGGIDAKLTDTVDAFVRLSYQEVRRTPFEGIVTYADGTIPENIGRSFFIGRTNAKSIQRTTRLNGGVSWNASSNWSVSLAGSYQHINRDGNGNGYAYSLQSDGTMNMRNETYIDVPTDDINVGISTILKMDDMGLPGSFLSASVRYQYYLNKQISRSDTGQFNLFEGEDAITQYLNGLATNSSATHSPVYREQRLRYLTASVQANIKLAEWISILAGISQSKPKVETRSAATDAWSEFDPGSQASLRGGITIEPIDGLNIYGSYSESFQPQDRIDINDNALPPLSGEQYEIGAKYITPDKRLLLSAALFDITQTNQQVFDQTGMDGIDRYKALGKVRHRGIELEAMGQVTDNWQVKAGFALLDTKIKEDSNSAIIGKNRTFIPKNMFSIFTQYEFENGLSIGLGGRYVDKMTTSYTNASKPIPSYFLADATVSHSFDQWRLQLNLKNILDKTYYTAAYDSLAYGVRFGEPRHIAISLTRDF